MEAEYRYEIDPSDANRMEVERAQADLLYRLKVKEDFLATKGQFQMAKGKGCQHEILHASVMNRQHKIVISRIQNKNGDWLYVIDLRICQKNITGVTKYPTSIWHLVQGIIKIMEVVVVKASNIFREENNVVDCIAS